MANLVCTGATLQCSFGTIPVTFSASGIQTSAGSQAGVVDRHNPGERAAVRGLHVAVQPRWPRASVRRRVPVLLAPWEPGSAQVTIDGSVPSMTRAPVPAPGKVS